MTKEELRDAYELASSYEKLAIKEKERADTAWRALELKNKSFDHLIALYRDQCSQIESLKMQVEELQSSLREVAEVADE